MSKETSVFVLGIIVFFGSFSGLPTEYKEWLFIVSGLLLMGIGYSLRRKAFLSSIEHESGERKSEVFSESEQSAETPLTQHSSERSI